MRAVVELARHAYGHGEVRYGSGNEGPHEAGWLALEVAKARTVLGVAPRWTVAEAVERTIGWYRAEHEGGDARHLCLADIADFKVLS